MRTAFFGAIAAIFVTSSAYAQGLDALQGVYKTDMGTKETPAPFYVRVTKDGALLQVSPPSLSFHEDEAEIPLEMRKSGTRIGSIEEKNERFTVKIPSRTLYLFSPERSAEMSIEYELTGAPLVHRPKTGEIRVGTMFDATVFKPVSKEEQDAAVQFEKDLSAALKNKKWVFADSDQVSVKDGKAVSSPGNFLSTGYQNGNAYKVHPDSMPKCTGIEFQPDGRAKLWTEDAETKERTDIGQVAYLIDAYQKLLVIEHPSRREVEGKKTREYTRFCVDPAAVAQGDLTLKKTPTNLSVTDGTNTLFDGMVNSRFMFKEEKKAAK